MTSYMILGGQWGSEGKGLFAGYMALKKKPTGVVCQFGPNAGHTWIEGDKPIVFKSLPVASISPSVKEIFLGPGSVINPAVLGKELRELGALMEGKTVYVHEGAAILKSTDAYEEAGEQGVTHIASTRQGTSIAMIRKIRRQGAFTAREDLAHLQVQVVSHGMYRDILWSNDHVQIEGAQGMDLSINAGHRYPYTTSRDCTPAQVLADCYIHPHNLMAVYVCIRTYPIRVGNIVGGNGVLLGTSGPCYDDQAELTWEQVGVKPELTTVTQRVRRVFSFSPIQTRKMLNELRPNGIFLNFANYLDPTEGDRLRQKINTMAGVDLVRWTGHGPKHTDIIEHEAKKRPPVVYQE